MVAKQLIDYLSKLKESSSKSNKTVHLNSRDIVVIVTIIETLNSELEQFKSSIEQRVDDLENPEPE